MPANAGHKTEPPVIEVKNLVKEYRLGALEGLRSIGRRMLGRGNPECQRFLALNDVSFNVHRGEVVGIIGHNGAGKSTLLKHLCRITTPTSGSVTVRGRVAPLIEVGAGLVGDMTGRENIYLNATILGLTRKEIDSKVNEIIEFAELEKFIDTPIKRYSSGMQIRLAFSIAIAVDADVLIVDEVLAVGDIAFQRKCYDRVSSLLSCAHKTVLIVSHNIRQIERLCTRAIFVEHGRVISDGAPKDVCKQYYAQMDRMVSDARRNMRSNPVNSTGEFKLSAIGMIDSQEQTIPMVSLHDPATCRFEFEVCEPVRDIDVALSIHTVDMIIIVTQSIRPHGLLSLEPGHYLLDFHFEDLALLPGQYAFRIVCQDQLGTTLLEADGVGAFVVTEGRFKRSDLSLTSLVHMPMTWTLRGTV